MPIMPILTANGRICCVMNRLFLCSPPRKKRKSDTIRSGDIFSTFVSSVRQPLKCFFNWLNRLTNLQTASMVRSLTGLLLHIFGRLAAALVSLIFNP